MRRPAPSQQRPRRQPPAPARGAASRGTPGGRQRGRGRLTLTPLRLLALLLAPSVALLFVGLSHLRVVRHSPSSAGDGGDTGDEDRDRSSGGRRGTTRTGTRGGKNAAAAAAHGGGGQKNPTERPGARATIGYAVSLTSCPKPDDAESLTDGGAVLRHSIHLNSIRGGRGGDDGNSNYDYATYAIVHPTATSCASQLADVGYTILVRDTPVEVSEIRGGYLRERITKNGCCGEKELIKLHAYTLMDHPVVVHLDLDTLILQPLDELFDAMLGHPPAGPIPVAFGRELPDQIDAYFTRDYNMKTVTATKPGLVQGGFLVLRPSLGTYDSLLEVIREGDFKPGSGGGSGWGGGGYNGYGSMTFQGLIPYYYDVVAAAPSQQQRAGAADAAPAVTAVAVELNRCIYNTMADNPRDRKTVNDVVHGNCRDGREECEDCRNLDFFPLIKTAHFTLCQKPWHCLPQDQDMIQKRLCRKLHHEWFVVRRDLEDSWGGKGGEGGGGGGGGTFQPDHFMGYCTRMGARGYVPMAVPPHVAAAARGEAMTAAAAVGAAKE